MTDLLISHLAAAVPLAMADLRRAGGITDWHVETAQSYLRDMRKSDASEAVLYRMPGNTQISVARLAECLAVMAFVPGGVQFGPLHFEAAEPVQQDADLDAFLAIFEPLRQAMDREERESERRMEEVV